jgi:hypothetical protein
MRITEERIITMTRKDGFPREHTIIPTRPIKDKVEDDDAHWSEISRKIALYRRQLEDRKANVVVAEVDDRNDPPNLF